MPRGRGALPGLGAARDPRRDRRRRGIRVRRRRRRFGHGGLRVRGGDGGGRDTGLAAALAVTAAGILAIEVSGLVFGAELRHAARAPRDRARRPGDRAQPGRLPDPGGAGGGAACPARATAGRAAPGRPARRARPHRPGDPRRARSLPRRARDPDPGARAVLRKDAEQADELLAAAQQMAAEGLEETRQAVHALRADTLPLDEELARVSDTHAQRYHVPSASTPAASPRPCRRTPPSRCCASPRRPWSTRPSTRRAAVAVRLDYGDADVRLTIRNDLAPGARRRRRPGGREYGQRRLRADRHAGTAPAAERHPRGGAPRQPVDRDRRICRAADAGESMAS